MGIVLDGESFDFDYESDGFGEFGYGSCADNEILEVTSVVVVVGGGEREWFGEEGLWKEVLVEQSGGYNSCCSNSR